MDILKKRFFNIKGLAIYIAIFAIVLTLGTSYAYFIYNKDGNSHELIAGNLYMNLTDDGSVSLTGLYPMSDSEGIKNGIKYNFEVSGYNLSNKSIYYGVYVNKGDKVPNKTRFRDSDIKFYLTETINGVTKQVSGPYSVDEINRNLLYANTVEGDISKDTPITISYQLTMWISDKVLISDSVTEMNGRSIYTTEEFKNSYASIKVEVYGDFTEKNAPHNYMARLGTADLYGDGSILAFWPDSIIEQLVNITEVNFVEMNQSEIDTRFLSASIKEDLTDTSKGGSVKAWLETDTTDTTKYIMYVASDGTTFFPSDSSAMFIGFENVKEINFDNINTNNVTNMMGMFYYCQSLTSLDLSNFDTSQVTNMSQMFIYCTGLTSLDVSNFDTSNATNMFAMFSYCLGLTSLDVSNFNTSQVTNMDSMFGVCSSLTKLDVSNFDTRQVTDMSDMFNGCSSLTTLDVSNFDTSLVNDMEQMFSGCSSLTELDVSNFDTSQVTDMSLMFEICSNLTIIYANSDWNTTTLTTSTYMFNDCTSLVGAVPYDSTKTDATMANPDTGYFTRKTA